MIKDITFGQYYISNSTIHRLDPRLKIVLTVFMIVLLFVCQGFASLGVFTIFSILVLIFSTVPVKLYLKNLKVIIPIIIFTGLLNLFYTKTGAKIDVFSLFSIYTDGIEKSIFMSLRIIILILLSSVLTYTTTPNDITDALERLFSSLKFVGLGNAVHTISMMMTIAIRFIPTLIEETDKIMNAQKARGAVLESGGLIKKIKALIPILIPLLISSIRKAYDLAEAMECRCYNGGVGRKRMKQFTFSFRDWSALFIFLLLTVSIILLNIYF